MRAKEIVLPHGLWLGGTCRRQVTVRALTGEDERQASEAEGPPAAVVSALVGRVASGLAAPGQPVTPMLAGSLSAGDRQAILLHAYALSVDPVLRAMLACPREGCGARIEVEAPVAALLAQPAAGGPTHEVSVGAAAGGFTLAFRVATGEDLEAVASREDPEEAADLLLARVLVEARPPDGVAACPVRPPRAWRAAVAQAMAEADPQGRTTIETACPECGGPVEARLDAAAFLLAELSARRGALLSDVHTLAFHYHWSEADILALAPERRRLYCGLVESAVAGGRA